MKHYIALSAHFYNILHKKIQNIKLMYSMADVMMGVYN